MTLPPADSSPQSAPPERFVIGCMTGTSLDGIDLAAARLTGCGLALRAEFVLHTAAPLGDLARDLRALAEQKPMTAGDMARLSRDFALAHARAIASLLHDLQFDRAPDLIAIHGQTVFHQPPLSWQLMNPWPIAQAFGCPVVTDLRGVDLAAGGQGAPITPLADWILFRDSNEARAVVNLGGFINITFLPLDDGRDDQVRAIRGGDLCACNQVLDAVARHALGRPFDEDGQAAARGTPDDEAVDALLHVLRAQRDAGRSLGTGDEAAAWVNRFVSRVRPDDLAASATEAIGRMVRESLASDGDDCENRARVDSILLAGGGARNQTLVRAIAADRAGMQPVTCRTSDDLGVPIEAREALAMAVLGALAFDGVPITLPAVTGGAHGPQRAGLWCWPTGMPPVTGTGR